MQQNPRPEHPILICSDDDQVLTSLSITLHSAGLTNLVVFQQTHLMREMLETGSFSLVLLDFTLPCPAGLGILEQAESVSLRPPFIIMTVTKRPRGCSCPAAGWVMACLPKPVDRETLLAAVHKGISRPGGAFDMNGRAEARKEEETYGR